MSDNEGKKIVNALLKQNFKKNSNYLSTDIILPVSDNDTIQIDHLLINEYGIFVINSQHYSVGIFGGETDEQWLQIYNTGLKLEFLNPLIQNKQRIKYLQQCLPTIPDYAFKSIVTFSGTAEFKTSAASNLVKTEDLLDYINQFKKTVLSLSEIEIIVGKIELRRKEQAESTDATNIDYSQNELKNKAIDKSNAKKPAFISDNLPVKKINTELTKELAEMEYAEYQEILTRNQPTKFRKEATVITDFMMVTAVILTFVAILMFIVYSQVKESEKTLLQQSANPVSTLTKKENISRTKQETPETSQASIKNPYPSEAALRQMQESFKRNAEKNRKQKLESKIAEQQVTNQPNEQITQKRVNEKKREEFKKQYKPRPECNDPYLEWSKTVKCINERITAREEFYATH